MEGRMTLAGRKDIEGAVRPVPGAGAVMVRPGPSRGGTAG